VDTWQTPRPLGVCCGRGSFDSGNRCNRWCLMYEYRATVHSIYDADTFRLNIDLGLKVWVNNEAVRLYGVDAPEMRGVERPAGLVARDYVRTVMPVGSDVTIRTYMDKKGKYGRWLADVFIGPQDEEPFHLATRLVELGHAVWKTY